MAKILTFRTASQKASETDFLTDETQTLSFDTAENGKAGLGEESAAAMQSLFPDHKKDWTNQELADLFRVHQLLIRANVPVDTDRGITDEGDPWFVFCYASGEVFIHLCRMDGLYLLDSPNVVRPLRGANFNELIADFTNQTLPATDSTETSERRVIRLERGGKISLHPSAMLAALIWTLLLASEDLVLLAPEEFAADDHGIDTDTLLTFDGMFAIRETNDPFEGDIIEYDTPKDAAIAKDAALDMAHPAADTQGQMREVTQQQGIAAQQNGFAAGLSTIAIAMGFMSEAALFNDQNKVLENLQAIGFSEYGTDAQELATLDIVEGEENRTLQDTSADFLNVDLFTDTEVAAARAVPEQSILQQELTDFTDDILTIAEDQASTKLKVNAPAKLNNKEQAQTDVPVAIANEAFEAEEVESAAATAEGEPFVLVESSADSMVLNLSEALQIWQQAQSAGLQADTIEISASFGVAHSTSNIPVPQAPTVVEEAALLNTFDALSERLIEFITNKGGDIGFIQRGDGFIAVDREAVKNGDVEYKEWETDDGKFIGLIGLQSDFQQFEMIA